jgi:2-haloacid dehalogenase
MHRACRIGVLALTRSGTGQKEPTIMPRICVFDVFETLLDPSELDPLFTASFGDAGARREWFAQVIQTALVTTLLGDYAEFTAIAAAALDMTAATLGVEVVPEERKRILGGMRRLPLYADVRDGLERLRSAGLRVVALSNAPQRTVEAQLINAGIRDSFEKVFSADEVRRLKPAPEPYRMVAERLNVSIANIRLFSCHAWDVAGALRAGCAAVYVARPGIPYDPLLPRPDIAALDVHDAAEQIVRAEIP